MARMSYWTTAPAGGWIYFQKETRFTMRSDNGDDLVRQIRAHREYKSLEPTDEKTIRLEVERQICARLSTRDCTAEGIEDEWVPIDDRAIQVFSLDSIMAVSNGLFSWFTSGAASVSDAEINARHEICATCPLNTHATGCTSCSLLGKMVSSVIPDGRKFQDLHVCGACGCSLAAKLNIPTPDLRSIDQSRDVEIKYPKWCWMNANSLQ